MFSQTQCTTSGLPPRPGTLSTNDPRSWSGGGSRSRTRHSVCTNARVRRPRVLGLEPAPDLAEARALEPPGCLTGGSVAPRSCQPTKYGANNWGRGRRQASRTRRGRAPAACATSCAPGRIARCSAVNGASRSWIRRKGRLRRRRRPARRCGAGLAARTLAASVVARSRTGRWDHVGCLANSADALRTRSAKSSAVFRFARSALSRSGQVAHRGAPPDHISSNASRAAVAANPSWSICAVAVRHVSTASLQCRYSRWSRMCSAAWASA